ncbi:hypothetical protein ACJX0J_040964, partial [Zea mays]
NPSSICVHVGLFVLEREEKHIDVYPVEKEKKCIAAYREEENKINGKNIGAYIDEEKNRKKRKNIARNRKKKVKRRKHIDRGRKKKENKYEESHEKIFRIEENVIRREQDQSLAFGTKPVSMLDTNHVADADADADAGFCHSACFVIVSLSRSAFKFN